MLDNDFLNFANKLKMVLVEWVAMSGEKWPAHRSKQNRVYDTISIHIFV
jgi:hypothetical protein